MFPADTPFCFSFWCSPPSCPSAVLGTVSLIVFATRDNGGSGGEKVGVIEIPDVITDAKATLKALKRFRENPSVRAIVMRIESPGGAVGPSQEIYREVLKTVKTKKVVASLGSVAASGGYYSAAGADGIMANPGTITGSIGVIMGFANFQELLKKIGLVPVVIKSGEFKDVGSPVREMTDSERQISGGLRTQDPPPVHSGRGRRTENGHREGRRHCRRSDLHRRGSRGPGAGRPSGKPRGRRGMGRPHGRHRR